MAEPAIEQTTDIATEYTGPSTSDKLPTADEEVITVPSDENDSTSQPKVDFHSACARCCKPFAELSQHPKLLPCLHSVCECCLVPAAEENALVDPNNAGQGECPQCGFVFDLCVVIDHLYIQEQLAKQDVKPAAEATDGEPTVHECTGCEEKECGTSFCVDCQEWLCEQCVTAHKRVRVTKDHKIVPKEEAPATDDVNKSEGFLHCKQHKQEKLMFFCEKCDLLTCRDCQLLDHKDHQYQFLDVAAANCKLILHDKLNEMTDRGKKLRQFRALTESRLAHVKDQHASTVKLVQSQADALIKQIIASARLLLQNAKVACETMARRLAKESSDVCKVLTEFDYCTDFIKDLIQDASDMTLLSAKSSILHQCDRVYMIPVDTQATKNNFSVQYRHDTQFLFTNLNKFGYIYVNNAKYHPQERVPNAMRHSPPNPQQTFAGGNPPPYTSPAQIDPSRMDRQQMLMALQRAASNISNNSHMQQSLLKLKQQQVGVQQIHQQPTRTQVAAQQLVQSLQGRPQSGVPPSVTSLVTSMRAAQPQSWSSQPVLRQGNSQTISFQRGFPHQQQQQPQPQQQQPQPQQQPFQPMRLQHRPATQQSVYASQGVPVVQAHPGRPTTQNRGPPPLIRSPVQIVPQPAASSRPASTGAPQPKASPDLPSGVRVKMERRSSFENDCVITAAKVKGERLSASACSGSTPKTTPSTSPAPSAVTSTATGQTSAAPSENEKNLEEVLQKLPLELGETFEDIDATLLSSTNLNRQLSQVSETSRRPVVESPGKNGTTSMFTDMSFSDPNEDYCACCHNGGEVLCCDTCPRVFHLNCHIPPLSGVPNGVFVCTLCSAGDNLRVTSPVPEDMLSNGSKRKAPGGLSDKEIRVCERITLELFCHPSSVAFHEPVSKQVPNYYKIIQDPIDFTQIKCKLARQHFNHYNSVEEFLSDVKLVFHNCATYNQENSEVGKAGKTVQKSFEDMVSKYLPHYLMFSKKYPLRVRVAETWDVQTASPSESASSPSEPKRHKSDEPLAHIT